MFDSSLNAEEELVRKTLQSLLQDVSPDAGVSEIQQLWRKLGSSGIVELTQSHKHPGLFVAAAEEAGYGMGSLPWTSAVLSAHLLSQSENRNGAELLTKLHSGQAIVVGLVSADADGSFKAVRSGEGWTVSGQAPLAEAAAAATHFLLGATTAEGDRTLLCVEAAASGLTMQAVEVVDNSLDADISIRDCPASTIWSEWNAQAVEAGLRAEQTARVAQAAGAMRRLLELTVAHTIVRQQFNQSLASFQGVQHRLAEMAQAVAEVDAAALLASTAPTPHNEAAARLLAIRHADLVWRHAVQLHGGLGMTAESPIRTHVRRLIGLNLRLGNEAELILLAAEHFGRKLPFGIFGEFAADDIVQTRDKTRHFLETDLEPWMQDADRKMIGFFAEPSATLPWHAALYRNGFSAPGWPIDEGGTGWTPAQRYVFQLEVERAEAPHFNQMGVRMVGPLLMKYGTDDQKAFHLPRILEGRTLWCQGFSEPNSGSDLASLRTRAVRQGENYVINGSKIWTTHAQYADWMFALVRTSTEGRKQDGISFLLIDMKTPGLTVRPITGLDGEHDLNEVFFDDVIVPIANRVGAENSGWEVAKSLLELERGGGLAAPELRARYERIQRPDHGSALVKWAALGVDLAVLEMMELMMLTDRPFYAAPAAANSMLKLGATKVRQSLGQLVVEAQGREALRFETPIRRMIADKAHSIFGGAAEIQKGIIAKDLVRGA